MKPPVFHRQFDYDRAKLPNPYLAQLEAGVADIGAARAKTGATIGYPGWMLLYYAALCIIDPDGENVLIETGTNLGCSTIVLAQALIDRRSRGQVITIEIDPAVSAQAQANFEAAGVSARIDRQVGDAKMLLPERLASVPAIRLAYLDGCHLHDDVMAEFGAVQAKLAPGGLVILDNTYEIAEAGDDPRVHGALKSILARHGGNLINFPFVSWFTPGLAIWQRAPFPA